jgi:hypothetical protein
LWGKGNKKEPQKQTKEIETKTAGNKKETEENYLSNSFDGIRKESRNSFQFLFYFRFISFMAAKRK